MPVGQLLFFLPTPSAVPCPTFRLSIALLCPTFGMLWNSCHSAAARTSRVATCTSRARPTRRGGNVGTGSHGSTRSSSSSGRGTAAHTVRIGGGCAEGTEGGARWRNRWQGWGGDGAAVDGAPVVADSWGRQRAARGSNGPQPVGAENLAHQEKTQKDKRVGGGHPYM